MSHLPGQSPAEPTAAAGYSGTPLHRKLGVKTGHRVLVVGVPAGWDLGRLDPERSATVTTRTATRTTTRTTTTPYDVVVAFCPDQTALERTLSRYLRLVDQTGRLWLCWPKRASGVATDLDEATVRERGLAAGVVDVKVCAVDATWSGLCFMTRLADRTAGRR